MSQIHTYQVHLKWKEGRIGEVSSPELEQTIECATPPEFANGVPNIWSPEHFYAAAINSCFMTTFLAIAESSRIEFESFQCETEITLEIVDKKFMITKAKIQPKVILKDSDKKDRMSRVLDKTKEHCLVTNSMKTEVTLVPEIN